MGSKEKKKFRYCFCGYENKDIAERDILGVIARYKNLSPSNGRFTFDDGSQKDLVSLNGTIPIMYRGHTYKIPIGISMMCTHPYNAPIVYVKPNDNMDLNEGPNVDVNGKVDLPYLRDWRYPESSLLELISKLVILFGKTPPVCQRSASQLLVYQIPIQQYQYQQGTAITDHRLLCKGCRLNPVEVTILPCGHFATCESCCRRLKKQHSACPICSGPINNVIRTFVPE